MGGGLGLRIAISLRTLLIVVVLFSLVGGGWIIIDWLIITDTERIDSLFDRASEAAERHDADFIVDECLDEEFALGNLDRERARTWAKTVLTTFKVKSIRKYSSDIAVDGDVAQATVRVFVSGGRIPGNPRLDWEVELRRRLDNRWYIRRVRAFGFMRGQRRELPLLDILKYANH